MYVHVLVVKFHFRSENSGGGDIPGLPLPPCTNPWTYHSAKFNKLLEHIDLVELQVVESHRWTGHMRETVRHRLHSSGWYAKYVGGHTPVIRNVGNWVWGWTLCHRSSPSFLNWSKNNKGLDQIWHRPCIKAGIETLLKEIETWACIRGNMIPMFNCRYYSCQCPFFIIGRVPLRSIPIWSHEPVTGIGYTVGTQAYSSWDWSVFMHVVQIKFSPWIYRIFFITCPGI